MGRLLKERSERARADVEAATRPHAALLRDVNAALEELFVPRGGGMLALVHRGGGGGGGGVGGEGWGCAADLLLRLYGDVHDTCRLLLSPRGYK